ncbi:DsbE family thiol:disulfide interchange protein [Antarctobacter heliothermus]|uniref:Cytochrome c biogenesis protein CcmG, thiol:disulfide interchange protein DsbE n=1 Tax=Antarctobacter heliothermus TaxID=74033 RepID=A0A239FFP1_9RHOB|nr:DsbE family thiol:disulfide interchange protein [Antarctobacter heliothermus]SNS54894.1 cytochrome c biogenesis protein CcmG, thiol:disulfide interchange protein DsbE [Antarctobacter heliothermus]
MAKFSPLMIAPPLIFAGLGLLFFLGLGRDGKDRLDSMFEGKPAPAMTEVALTGYDPITPEMLAGGEVTLVNFWASWCPPCRAEHPVLLQMQKDGLRIVGVNFKDQAANATKYLEDDGNPFAAVAFDPAGRTAIDWGVTGPPETFILDGDGTVVFKFVGPLVGTDYQQRFVPKLNEALGR